MLAGDLLSTLERWVANYGFEAGVSAVKLILDSKLTLRVVELADINGLRLSFPYT